MQQEAPKLRDVNIWGLITGAEAPDWSRGLLREHLNSEARLAVYGTCRAGRDLVVNEAEHTVIKLNLTVNEDQPFTHAKAKVQAARSAMLARGRLHTSLHITAATSWPVSYALGVLEGATTWLAELAVDIQDEQCSTSILAAMALACPNLKKLVTNSRLEGLPSPDVFPNLEELCITGQFDRYASREDRERVIRTTRPFVRQIKALTMDVYQSGGRFLSTSLPLLLGPASIGTHLRSLQVPIQLNDTTLGLLLQCAPVLQQLRVHSLKLQSDIHANASVTWRELDVTNSMRLASLARLPVAAGLSQLVVPSDVDCDVHTPAAAEALAVALARFSPLALQPYEEPYSICLWPSADTDMEAQPAALRAGISLIHSLPRQEEAIALSGWSMSAAIVLLLPGLPAWRKLRLPDNVWSAAFTSHAALLRLLPGSFRDVRFDTTGLTSAQVESICLAAPMGVIPDGPFHLEVSGCAASEVEAIQHRMQEAGVYPDVVVSQD